MTSPAGDMTINGADAKPLKPTAAKRSTDADEGAFPRLQERTQTQLGFINNLLITLAIGLLAFEVNASANSPGLDRSWREVVLLLGLLGLTLSVLAGLRLAFNRLASHRITTRVSRLRQLRDRYRNQNGGIYELRGLRRQAVFSRRWAWWTRSKKREKEAVHTAARNLARLIPEPSEPTTDSKITIATMSAPAVEPAVDPSPPGDAEPPTADGRESGTSSVSEIVEAADALVDALRRWYERADEWTWVWLRVQTWCFICGGVLLLVGPAVYFIVDHGGK